MAPFAEAIAQYAAPIAHQLVVRQQTYSNGTIINKDQQGKTDQEWAAQGRYNYDPSFAAAVIFLVLYVIATVINLVQYLFYRTWFWWVMVLAVIMELVGYAARAISIKHLDSKGVFIIQTIFLLVPPAVMAAACYMAFGRLIIWILPPKYQSFRHLWLPARRITPVFVCFDVLSFFVQVMGGAMIAGADTIDKENRGKNVILGGLGLQLVTFGFFVISSIRLSVLLRTKLRNEPLPHDTNWRLLLAVINAASLTILIRSIFRFVEFVIGVHNYLSDHEAFFYCLDALLIFSVVVGFLVVHPGNYLPYIGFRRKNIAFSRNVDRGFFTKLARGRGPATQSGVEMEGRRQVYSTEQ